MKNIHFIINPIAGSGKNLIEKAILSSTFNSRNYILTIKKSAYKSHAIALAQESVKEKAHIVVACGGDGTINEVASCLVNTSVILGIVPIGSGNGLASNLHIPKNISKVLSLIKNESVKKIDVGKINNRYFFSNFGVGFDADVIQNYETSKSRKLISYIKSCLKSVKELKYQKVFKVTFDDKVFEISPFLVFVSNSNELGYNISLTPKASLQDGFLDILIVSKLTKPLWTKVP